MIYLDRPGLVAAAALLTTLALSALWAGIDLYSARNDFASWRTP